ncbi:flagellar FLiS export co-chaperone, partial [Campylobacter jejuni]|nr:flagellar FLiS export co-chaperone [Campylobacter jejuni]
SNYEGVLAYIQDKRDEIKIILSELSTAITMGETMDNAGIYNSTMDFKNLFK